MWLYIQGSGSLYSGTISPPFFVTAGYSGIGIGLNNPDLQEIHEIGPIPIGLYTIEPPIDTPTHGPYVLPLTPNPANEMFGRSGFLIHGDSVRLANEHAASRGCIILPRDIREKIWTSEDHILKVTKA